MANKSSAQPIKGALAEALSFGRERFNALFEYHTQVLRQRIDPEEFSIHLMENLAPVAEAVAKTERAAVNPTVEALYGVSLELMGAGYLGLASRYKWPEKVFYDLLPHAAPLIAQNPRLVAASLLNAAIAMEAEPGARPEEWLEAMKSASLSARTPKELLDSGMVLSWRCGMAHFRMSALSILDSLPAALALSLFPKENARDKKELLEKLAVIWPEKEESKPPQQTRKPSALIGGFTGFGGPFDSPPILFMEEGRICACDRTGQFCVYADRFGAVIKKLGPAPSHPPKAGVDRKLEAFAKSAFPSVTSGSGQTKSWVYDGATLAVSLSVSHKIFLFPLKSA